MTTITDSSNNHIGKTERLLSCKTVASVPNAADSCLAASTVVNIFSPTTYKVRTKRVDLSGTGSALVEVSSGNYDGSFYATRIA